MENYELNQRQIDYYSNHRPSDDSFIPNGEICTSSGLEADSGGYCENQFTLGWQQPPPQQTNSCLNEIKQDRVSKKSGVEDQGINNVNDYLEVGMADADQTDDRESNNPTILNDIKDTIGTKRSKRNMPKREKKTKIKADNDTSSEKINIPVNPSIEFTKEIVNRDELLQDTMVKKIPKRKPRNDYSEPKRYSCDQCEYKTDFSGNLKKHQFTHSDMEKRFCCHYCGYKTNYSSNMNNHYLIHTREKKFECDQCDYITHHPDNLRSHLVKHAKEKTFLCDWCDFTTKTFSCLKVHTKTHVGASLEDNKINGVDFIKNNANLPSNVKIFSCDTCDYKSRHLENLKNHTCTIDKIFSCTECDYKTETRRGLNKHLYVHIGGRRFSCHLCDYTASKESLLKNHQTFHLNGDKFICTQCEFETKDARIFKNHKLTHFKRKKFTADKTDDDVSNPMRYSCDQCDYQTRNPKGIRKHKIVHSDIKNFACDECEFRTKTNDNLKKHKTRKHGG